MAQPHAGTCPGTLGGHDEEPHLVPGPRTQSLAQQRRDTDPVTVVHRGGEAAHTRGTLERGWGRAGAGRGRARMGRAAARPLSPAEEGQTPRKTQEGHFTRD